MATEQKEIKKIAVTIITGFLGAGKTTLLKHILTHKHGKKIAVIENEFAQSIGVSNELHGADDGAVCVAEVFETSNGCICCGSKDEFISTLYELIQLKDKIDYIIVETTGRADPVFVQVFELDPILKTHLYIDGIVTLLDAQNALSHLNSERSQWKGNDQIINEAQEQIAVADRIIINKTDLVKIEEVDEIQQKLKNLNQFAQIIKSEFSKVDVSQVLDVKAFDIDNILKQDEGFLQMRPFRTHDATVRPLNFEGIGSVDLEVFTDWIQKYLQNNEVLRAKGVICITGKSEKYVFQSVRQSVDISPYEKWGEKESPISKLVFIGKKLSEKVLMESFPSTMQIRPVMRYTAGDRPAFPKAQFVLLFIALMFLKGADILEYGKNNPIVAGAVLLVLGLGVVSYLKNSTTKKQEEVDANKQN